MVPCLCGEGVAELDRGDPEARPGQRQRRLARAAADFEQVGAWFDAGDREQVGVEVGRVVGAGVLVGGGGVVEGAAQRVDGHPPILAAG